MKRLCPLCAKQTDEARCPDDGTVTLMLTQVPDLRLTEGQEINGRYVAGELIGKGGFGAVYRATSLATGQEVAIKVMGISLADDDAEQIQRFYAEAQITAALKHPNTIRVFDFGQTDDGALYIAMELLSGKELTDLLRERRADNLALTQQETIRIATQTLRSLSEAHIQGLVHRDLKPHNIFLNEVAGDEPMVKVLDFGIAKRLGSNFTGTGQAFGTPAYMSPEQAQNQPVDARSDLYSLAAVMYQCVTGRCPFEGDNPLAVLLAHVTDPPPSVLERTLTPISVDFAQVIHRALSKRREDRFTDAKEMRQALDSCSPAPSEMPLTTALSPEEQALVDADTVGRTAAYSPVVTDARIQQAQSGPNLQFHAVTPAEAEVVDGDEATHDEPEYPSLQPKRGAGGAVGIVVAVAIVIAGGLWWSSSSAPSSQPEAPPNPSPTASPPAPEANAESPAEPTESPAEVTAAAAPDADTEQGGDVAGAGADAGVKDAKKTKEVVLNTEPEGAEVTIDGKVMGKSPVQLRVPVEAAVRVTLSLKGHRTTEVLVQSADSPLRTVKLTAESRAKSKRRKSGRVRRKAPPKPRPEKAKPKTPKMLDERL